MPAGHHQSFLVSVQHPSGPGLVWLLSTGRDQFCDPGLGGLGIHGSADVRRASEMRDDQRRQWMRRSKDGGVTGNQFAPKRGAALLAEGEHSGLHSCGLESLRVSGSKAWRGRQNTQPPPEPTTRPWAGLGRRGGALPRGGAIGCFRPMDTRDSGSALLPCCIVMRRRPALRQRKRRAAAVSDLIKRRCPRALAAASQRSLSARVAD